MTSQDHFGCELCDAHPSKGDYIERVSPKGQPFVGRCPKHLQELIKRGPRD